jgi:hypothetical protein
LLQPSQEIFFISLYQEKIIIGQTDIQLLELIRHIVPDALYPQYPKLALPRVRKPE